MKATAAILLSFLLVWTQSFALTAAAPRQTGVCRCCAGVQMACCPAPPGSASQQTPATPTRATSQHQAPLLLAAAPFLLTPPAPMGGSDFPALLSSLPATAVPLYERNCSYLI